MPFIAHNRRRRLKGAMLSLFLIISVLNVRVLSAQQQNLRQPIRVRIFNMRNIAAQQAKDYLLQTQVGDTIVVIPGTTAISVTANPEHLVFASSILKLVDSNEQFDVQFLDIEPDKTLPSSEEIRAKLGEEFAVGTLFEGPVSSSTKKIIVDKYKDKILIISPAKQTTTVVKTVQDLLAAPKEQEVKTENQKNTVPSANDVNFVQEPVVIEANKTEVISKPDTQTDDEMLGEFMNELTEAAKTDAEAKKVIAEPSQAPQPVVEAEKIQTLVKPQPETLQAKQEELPHETDKPVEQNSVAEKIPISRDIDMPNGDEILELNLPEKLDVVALIDLVGKQLNLNYLYDETKITGSVTVKVQGKIRVRELYNLLESVLKFRGFIMSRKGNLVTIAPASEVLDQDPKFVDSGIKPGDVSVTNVFHLNYISTAAAKSLLTEMKLGSNITEIPETSTLVVTEYAFRIQRIEELLNLVDVPGPPKEFKLRVLKYTLAESLVPKVKDLAEQLGTVEVTIGTTTPAAPSPTIRGRTARMPRNAPVQPQMTDTSKTGVYIDFDKRTNRVLMIGLVDEISAVNNIIDSLDVPQQDLRIIQEYEMQYVDINKIVEALKELNIVTGVSATGTTSIKTTAGPGQPASPTFVAEASLQGTASLDQPQIVMLETTNSLLVNATPEQHIQISQVISYVDREPVQAAIPYRIYRLENQEPEALAEVLNGLIEKTVQDKEGKIQQTVKYTEDNIAIVPDKNTFSLIVYASRKNQEWIGNLIKSLDKRRPQVLIDVSLVEITRDDKFQIDLDVIGNAKELATSNIAVTGSAVSSLFPAAASVPHSTVLEGGYFITSGNDEISRGFYNEGKIQALFNMIDKNGYGRVLARPKILVNDNEEGTISTEDTTYIAQTTDATLPGTTTGGTTSDTVRVSTSYTPYTAKIELKITPQISEGSLLRLVIAMQRNDFQSTKGSTTGPPDEKKSNVDTIVTVPDGSTIILGGLTKLNQTKTANKVPLLGDVPIVGTLFRKTSKVDVGNKLYVFVKANILRPEETEGLKQLEDISRTNRVEFERAESKFQQYQEFPGIKSQPMEPNNVLEQ